MIALLKKDRLWLLTSLLLGSTVFAIVLWDRRPDLLWIGGERSNTDEMLTVWWICAGVLGLYAGLRDRLLGTREYLLQRPVRPGRVFWVRCLGCFLVMTAGALLPYLLMWASPFDTENRALWEFNRLWISYALSTSMWTFFAIGMYAATVPASKVSAVFQTGVIGVPFGFVSWRVMFPLGSTLEVSPWFYMAVQAVLAAGLLLLSAKHFARGQDRDRDIGSRLKVCNITLVSVCAVLLAAIGVSEFQREAYNDHARAYRWQSVREWEDGTFQRLRRRWDGEKMLFEVLDPGGAWVEDPIMTHMLEWIEEQRRLRELGLPASDEVPDPTKSRRREHVAFSDDLLWPDVERQLEPSFDEERCGHALGGMRRIIRATGAGGRSHAYLQLPAGVLEVYRFADRRSRDATGRKPWKRTFSRSDGGAFPLHTRFLVDGKGGPLFAYGPDDWSEVNFVWVLEEFEAGSRFTRVSLPGAGPELADIFLVDAERLVNPDAPRAPRYRVAVSGTEGLHVWEDGRFVLAPVQPLFKKTRPSEDGTHSWSHVDRSTDDVFGSRLVFRDDAGKVLYEVTYRSTGLGQRLDVGLVYAATILRSPLLTLASLGFEPPGIWPFDPLITYGGRPGLIALNLAFAGMLAFLTRRRLRRMHANRATLRLWTILVLVGGLPVCVVFLFVERKRAHAQVEILAPIDVPPLLIHTA